MRIYMAAVVSILTLVLICTASVADPYTTEWWPEAAQAEATNSWIGSTGMLNTPTANIAKMRSISSSIHWVNTEPDAMTTVSFNAGINENLEVGAARLTDAFGTSSSETVANVKYNISLDRQFQAPKAPQFAVGVWDAGDALDRAYYGVITKDFANPDGVSIKNLRLNVGYGKNEEEARAVLDGMFGGLAFSPFQNGVIQAEYDGNNTNYGFEYSLNETVSVEAASFDGEIGLGVNVDSGF